MIKSVRFDALETGPHLVVLGAVHGNEKCGTLAIERLIQELQDGSLSLLRGSLTCVPIANPRAYSENQRFCERNLNRALYIKETPQAYEDFIDPILCRILDQADVLIDLHSYASSGGAFCFLGNSSEQEISLCRHLGVSDFVYGWSDAFGKAQADPRDSMGTVEYVRSKGGIGTTVECGQHLNSDAPAIAYKVIRAGLAHLNLVDEDVTEQPSQRFVQMHSVYFKDQAGLLENQWRHYDSVQAGQVLATYESGEAILAPSDGFIVLPKLDAPIGGEWFYFGIATHCPLPSKG